MKLIVALDGSETAEAVLEPAARLARAARAEVLLLSVLDPVIDAAHVRASSVEEAMERATAQRQDYLQRKTQAFGEQPVATATEQLHDGEDVARCIARVARREKADIVVVASKRASSVTGLILGSVAQELLRVSPCPVLIVRPG